MSEKSRLMVTLPDEMVAELRRKVAAGQYESESAAVEAGLRMLEEEAASLERWLREEVAPELRAVRADPSLEISSEEVRAALDEEYAGGRLRQRA